MTTIEPMRQSASEGPLLPAPLDPSAPTGRARAVLPVVRVNLLPGEVTAARRGHRTRRIVLAALVVLVVVLAAVSFFARSGVGDARGDLGTAEAVNATLRAQQGEYAEVVRAQSAVEDAKTRIGTLMTGDLDWAVVTRTILAAAPAGVTVSGVEGTGDQDSGTAGGAGGASGGTGTTTDPAAAPAAAGAAAGTAAGAPAAGTATAATPAGVVTVLGFAPDPKTVAAFVDALTKVEGLTEVAATIVAAIETGGYSFSIAASITTAVLTPRPATTGGR